MKNPNTNRSAAHTTPRKKKTVSEEQPGRNSSAASAQRVRSSGADRKRTRGKQQKRKSAGRASARRRKRQVRQFLFLAALLILFILCAFLLTSGIRRLLGVGRKDKIPPVITLKYDADYTVAPWAEYEEEGFSASDDRDGDLTDRVERTVTDDKVCYKVSDSAGNMTVLYRDIPYDTSYKDATGKDFPVIDIDDPDAEGKIVYLTFDDGPGPYTEELLQTLDRYGVHVTFFVTGAFPAYEDMIKKEDAAGHSVAVHTFSHDFEKIYKDDKAFWKDIDQIEEVVQRQTGHRTNLMRFAGGSSNTISSSKLMSKLIKQVPEKGFQYFDWNISSGDGGAEGDMEMVITRITSQLPDHGTCVVLSHDTKEYTVHAMNYLIPWLLDHGYDIQPLQFDSEPAHHGVLN